MRQINLRLPEDLLARVESARGGMPRERWLRQAVERALGDGDASPSSPSSEDSSARSSDGEAPAEQLEQASVNGPSLVPRPASVQGLTGESRADFFRRATQR